MEKKCNNYIEEIQTPCGELFDAGEDLDGKGIYITATCKECLNKLKEGKKILK